MGVDPIIDDRCELHHLQVVVTDLAKQRKAEACLPGREANRKQDHSQNSEKIRDLKAPSSFEGLG